MELLGFFAYPLLACILLVLIHTYFGIHILERGIIFVDLALAQFIGVGIAVSFLLGYDGNEKYVFSVLFAGLGAYLLAHSRRIARVTNIEAFIGVLYIFSLAAAILILDRTPHGLEDFKMILNGSILWVGPKDLIATSLLYAAIGLFQYFFRNRFFDLSYKGQGGFVWEFLFFSQFCAGPCQVRRDGGHPSGVCFLDHSGLDRQVFYSSARKDTDRRMGPGFLRQRHGYHDVLCLGSSNGARYRGLAQCAFPCDHCGETDHKRGEEPGTVRDKENIFVAEKQGIHGMVIHGR